MKYRCANKNSTLFFKIFQAKCQMDLCVGAMALIVIGKSFLINARSTTKHKSGAGTAAKQNNDSVIIILTNLSILLLRSLPEADV